MKRSLLSVLFFLSIALPGLSDTQYYITNPVFHVDDPTTGEPLSGGLVYFYQAGSTTKKDTYNSSAGATANSNPVELDSYGNAIIYGASTYKVVITRPVDPAPETPTRVLNTIDYVQVSQTVTAFASGLLADADAAAVRARLGLGSAALVNSGTGANNALVLNATGALPAIDGSLLTGLTEEQTRVFPQGYLSGFTMSNYTSGNVYSDIEFATGSCRDSGNTENIILSSVMVKSVSSAFAEGTGNGGNLSGYVAGSYTWHAFVIKAVSPETEREDIGFSSSLTPTLPSGFSKYRRVGSVITDDTGYIIRFHQFGDEFYWDEPQLDIDADGSANITTTETTYTLTRVPSGVSVEAIISAFYDGNSDDNSYFALYPTTVTPPVLAGMVVNTWIQNPSQSNIFIANTWILDEDYAAVICRVRTNTSAQIKGVCCDVNNYIAGIIIGWVDRRGRDD